MSTLPARLVLAEESLHTAPRTEAAPVAPWAPRYYRAQWRPTVLAIDVLGLAIAFGFGFGIAWIWANAHPSLGGCSVIALALLAWFSFSQRYTRTLSIVSHDELYYAIAYVAIGAAALLPTLALLGITQRSYVAIAVGIVLSAVLIGIGRYALRLFVGESELFIAPLAVLAGHGSRAEDVADRLRRSGTAGEAIPAGARIVKRAFDIFVSVIGLLLSAPIMALAALAIVLESGFPIMYAQERVGEYGRLFRIFKLRSMRTDAERTSGPIWAVTNDLRVTRIGRIIRSTSIDELPQLINVLRGEMSIVGPRPERPAFAERFSKNHPRFSERLLVAPGITACSHLYMPRAIDDRAISERLEYDLYYIRNWSLAMDIAIVIKTAVEVVFHRAP